MSKWTMSEDGRHLYDEDFNFDVRLDVDGDFAEDHQRIAYTKALLTKITDDARVERNHDASTGHDFDDECTRCKGRYGEHSLGDLACPVLGADGYHAVDTFRPAPDVPSNVAEQEVGPLTAAARTMGLLDVPPVGACPTCDDEGEVMTFTGNAPCPACVGGQYMVIAANDEVLAKVWEALEGIPINTEIVYDASAIGTVKLDAIVPPDAQVSGMACREEKP